MASRIYWTPRRKATLAAVALEHPDWRAPQIWAEVCKRHWRVTQQAVEEELRIQGIRTPKGKIPKEKPLDSASGPQAVQGIRTPRGRSPVARPLPAPPEGAPHDCAIDRTRYMDETEALRLRTVTQAWAITDLEAGRLRGPLVWAVVDVAMLTGLRVSEIARLTVGDLDAKRGVLRVWRHKRKPQQQETLAVPPDLAEHLAQFVAWKGQTDKDLPMFVGKRGPLTPQGLEQLWKVAVKRAGLRRELSIHSARHTLAVHLLRKTRNLRQVQKQLGHADPATTAKMYSDVSFEDMRAGVTELYER
ncbi:MAG: site-specific integrase [Planctomycetota bacterium]|nr:site-specific integrase [Planctomycetota bacterium]